MKILAPFEVWQQSVPVKSGQASGNRVLVVPVRYCKQRFIGEAKSRIGNWYKPDNGQLVGWWDYFAGKLTWRLNGTKVL